MECDSTEEVPKSDINDPNPNIILSNLTCNICFKVFENVKAVLVHTGNDHLEETLQYVMKVILKQ